METYGLEEQIMKKVFGVLAFLSFFYLLGVVGAVEQDTMALGAGMVRMGMMLTWRIYPSGRNSYGRA